MIIRCYLNLVMQVRGDGVEAGVGAVRLSLPVRPLAPARRGALVGEVGLGRPQERHQEHDGLGEHEGAAAREKQVAARRLHGGNGPHPGYQLATRRTFTQIYLVTALVTGRPGYLQQLEERVSARRDWYMYRSPALFLCGA